MAVWTLVWSTINISKGVSDTVCMLLQCAQRTFHLYLQIKTLPDQINLPTSIITNNVWYSKHTMMLEKSFILQKLSFILHNMMNALYKLEVELQIKRVIVLSSPKGPRDDPRDDKSHSSFYKA